jgi:hypothetical protein
VAEDYSGDFEAIASGAKKSPAFREMTGGEGGSDDEGGSSSSEDAHLADAFAAAQDGNEAEFKASMLAAIKSCIASYGTKK